LLYSCSHRFLLCCVSRSKSRDFSLSYCPTHFPTKYMSRTLSVKVKRARGKRQRAPAFGKNCFRLCYVTGSHLSLTLIKYMMDIIILRFVVKPFNVAPKLTLSVLSLPCWIKGGRSPNLRKRRRRSDPYRGFRGPLALLY
jgi:hypothetical protein